MHAPEGPARQPPAAPPESRNSQPPWPGLDRLGWLQAIGGLLLGLIALFSSYDHITLAGTSVQLQQQWGIPLIAASVATVLVDSHNWRPVREIERRTRLIEERTRLIEIEIEQLRAENAKWRSLNASIQRLCFPPESSSTPPPPTEPDCGPSSP